jgi:hypothetical protein
MTEELYSNCAALLVVNSDPMIAVECLGTILMLGKGMPPSFDEFGVREELLNDLPAALDEKAMAREVDKACSAVLRGITPAGDVHLDAINVLIEEGHVSDDYLNEFFQEEELVEDAVRLINRHVLIVEGLKFLGIDAIDLESSTLSSVQVISEDEDWSNWRRPCTSLWAAPEFRNKLL